MDLSDMASGVFGALLVLSIVWALDFRRYSNSLPTGKNRKAARARRKRRRLRERDMARFHLRQMDLGLPLTPMGKDEDPRRP